MVVRAADRERIPSPSEIKNFREVRKEGSALTGIRITPTSTVQPETKVRPDPTSEKEKKAQAPAAGNKNTAKEPVLIKAEVQECVSVALDKKDNALKALLPTMQEKATVAIDARNACQKAALAKTTAREQAVANKACVTTYQTTLRKNMADTKLAKAANWKTFRQDLKACAGTNSGDIEIPDGEDQL